MTRRNFGLKGRFSSLCTGVVAFSKDLLKSRSPLNGPYRSGFSFPHSRPAAHIFLPREESFWKSTRNLAHDLRRVAPQGTNLEGLIVHIFLCTRQSVFEVPALPVSSIKIPKAKRRKKHAPLPPNPRLWFPCVKWAFDHEMDGNDGLGN